VPTFRILTSTPLLPQGVVEYGVFYFPSAGVGTFTVDRRTEKASYERDSFCLFPPGVPLRWDRTSPTELALISISTKKVAEICHHFGGRVQDISITLKPSVNLVLTPLVATLIVVEHIHDAFIGQLLSLTFCPSAKKVNTYRASGQRLRQAVDFMMAHLDNDIDLAQIAQAAFMSKYHFARTFSNAFGVSPARWLTNARLDHAAQLLKDVGNVQSIQSIASNVGFASASSFDRAFKRCHGISPLQYRATAR
jgi:AraC-like DNA-binding protein